MRRYEVEWASIADVDREMAKPGMEPDDRIDVALNCFQGRNFPSKGLAIAYAKRVLPESESGQVRVALMESRTIDCHDGGPLLTDWDLVGEVEWICE